MRRRVDDSEDVSLYYEAKERAYEVPIKEQVIDTRLREIVSLGATLSGDELDGFLSERCSDDSALMQTAVRLLSIPAVVHGGAESDAQSLCVTSVVWPTQPRHMVSRDDSIQWDPLPPGSVLSHRYLIEEYLASGGIGRVYRALDQELDAPVALKTLRPEIANAPAAHRRFKQEVLLARSVTHRHVCRIFDLGCDEERNLTFLTMEFLAGETLQSYIRRNGAVGPVLALSWARQLSGALDTAHRAGIIHCDFKSGNVMVVPGPDGVGRAVVTDFGLAVAVERGVKREPLSERNVEPVDSGISDSASECGAITSPPWEGTNVTSGGSRGPLVGTPSYMSPEQVRGEFLDAASDLYSFGVVLFEMITGRLPFAAPTPRAAALAHVMEEPPDPKSFADVANRWSETILRLLSKEPSQRFSTGREVVSALEGLGGCEVLAGHSIPAECDTFVARTEELRSLVSALESSEPRAGTRVLTIVGPGGTGKTRLAINYGWASVNRWEGGVWFCDLSEARDVEGIVSAVAKSLDVPLGKTDPVRQLEHAIGSRAGSLIILDNFEQVVDYAIPTLGSWATSAARVKFLVTSRERLHVPGELVLELEPLDPETDGTELFEVRARNSRAGFEVGADNRARIQEIVRRLDGIPLAIELAAGRLRILSLDQLAERLEDRFQLLTGGVLGRHQTLRVVMDWSWELLTSWERSAVAQASVFEGGFMLDAAEHVLDVSSASESPPAIDLVQSLVDKSWLSVRVVGERPRFWMYSTIQEYASERLSLDEVPEPEVGRCDREARPQSAAHVRHGQFFARMGSDASLDAMYRQGGVVTRDLLAAELENLIAACRRAVIRGDEEIAVATLAAAGVVLAFRGPFSSWVRLAHEVVGTLRRPELRGRGLMELARAERLVGAIEDAQRAYEAALTIHLETGNRRLQGETLTHLGIVLMEQGRMEESQSLGEKALRIHRAEGNQRFEAVALANLGILELELGHNEIALSNLERSLEIHKDLGNSWVGSVFTNLGIVYKEQGKLSEALASYDAALSLHHDVGDRRGEGIVRGNIGVLLLDQGRSEEAVEYLVAALEAHRQLGDRRIEGVWLGNLGTLYKEEGRLEEARDALNAALAIHRDVGNASFEGVVLGTLGNLDKQVGRLDEARRNLEIALVIHREVGDLRSEGVRHGDLGDLSRQEGQTDEARGRFDDGERLLRSVGDPLELAKFLTLRIRFEMAMGRRDEGLALLRESEALARQAQSSPGSSLMLRLAELRQSLDDGDSAGS